MKERDFSDITSEIDEMLARPDVQEEVAAVRAEMREAEAERPTPT